MSVQQVYAIARNAGFDSATAREMVAIAQRESALNPQAACIDCLKRPDGSAIRESSIGLWQINTNDPSVWSLVQRATGISSPEQLKDPLINARAAYALYGGNRRNLDIAWRIDRDGQFPYATRYRELLAQLPSTRDLEASLSASGGGTNTATAPASTGGSLPDAPNRLPVFLANPRDVTLLDDGDSIDNTASIALIAGALLLVYAIS